MHHKDAEPIMYGLSYAAGVAADTSIILQMREVCTGLLNHFVTPRTWL